MNEKIKAIKRAIKKRDLFMKIFCWILIKLGYSNYELQTYQIRAKKFVRLRKKYQKYLDELEFSTSPQNEEVNPNVWICWFQGMEEAPDIIKKCNESVRFFLPDKNIHIITEKNMEEYVEIPAFVLEKFRKKIIPYAQMSDILRTMLLVKYGGMWLDATVLLTDTIPAYIYQKPLFLFQMRNSEDHAVVKNSWFIYAQKGNRILRAVQELLVEYWRKENILREYFLWHNFMKMALEKYEADAENIYYVSDVIPHNLGHALFKPFDPVYWEQIKKWSAIHKLSYYIFHTKNGKMPKDVSGTFFEHVMSLEFRDDMNAL